MELTKETLRAIADFACSLTDTDIEHRALLHDRPQTGDLFLLGYIAGAKEQYLIDKGESV